MFYGRHAADLATCEAASAPVLLQRFALAGGDSASSVSTPSSNTGAATRSCSSGASPAPAAPPATVQPQAHIPTGDSTASVGRRRPRAAVARARAPRSCSLPYGLGFLSRL